MKRLLILCATFALIPAAHAQAASCICTAGCKIASGPFAVNPDAPTSCSVKNAAGAIIGTSATVLSNTIPLNNSTVCIPGDAAYVPGPAGSVACLVSIPAQPLNTTVSVTMFANNAKGPSADSTALTFQSVSAIPSNPPAVPVGVRVSP